MSKSHRFMPERSHDPASRLRGAILLLLCVSLFLPLAKSPAQDGTGEIFWTARFSEAETQAWQWQNCQFSLQSDDVLRLTTEAGSKDNLGTFSRPMPSHRKNAFLQVHMGDIEDIAAQPRVFFNNQPKRNILAALFKGWNTMRIPATAQSLELGQLGNAENIGPWVDYRQIRIVEKPLAGISISCPAKDADQAIQLGDELLFEFHAENRVPGDQVELQCFLYPQMLEYSFNGEKNIVLKHQGNSLYTARIRIDPKTQNCDSSIKTSLMALVKVQGEHSYFTLPNKLDIVTENLIPRTLTQAGNLQTQQSRQHWFELTQGKNLALGRPLMLIPKPSYGLTSDENDVHDLTDGLLSNRRDDKIWFDRKAVGWLFAQTEALLMLDLGELRDVDRLVLRCLGGGASFQYPSSFELYVSKDKQLYHQAAVMKKLMPAESDQSDFVNHYYLEESGGNFDAAMYPFVLDVQAEARFLLLRVSTACGRIFSDELAVIEAEQRGERFNAAYQSPGLEIPLEGLLINTRLHSLDIIRGFPAPQRFEIDDLREQSSKNDKLELVLDLPPGISVVAPEMESQALRIDAANYSRYRIPIQQKRDGKLLLPLLYLGMDTQYAGSLPAYSMARCNEVDQHRFTLPLRSKTLPEIPRFEKLHISLSWMSEGNARGWPDFFNQWHRLGFNCVSTFPRYWNDKDHQAEQDFVAEAKKHGYAVIMNDSAFHVMMSRSKRAEEIFCIPKRTDRRPCPSYRGQYYQTEMERVARCVEIGRPDYIFYDIECFWNINQYAARCQRCLAGCEASGKNLDEFVLDCLAEQRIDLDRAVRQGAAKAGIAPPIIGDYAYSPLRFPGLFQRTYPRYIRYSMPSRYVAGRSELVHDTIRANHKALGNKDLIPWLTAGTYGEMPPHKIEQMVLETLLNGAGGITYYKFDNFTDSPFDFYYQASALAMLRPYEDLILDATLLEQKGSNQELFYSGMQKGPELLLLVGNYLNAAEECEYEFPWDALHELKDLRSGESLSPARKLRFQVPKGDFRLFYAKAAN